MASISDGFGRRLAETRERAGLTQKQLATAMNSTVPTISRWETGNVLPSAQLVITLAQNLGCTIDWLLAGVESPTPLPPHPDANVAYREFLETPPGKTASAAERRAIRVLAGIVPDGRRPTAYYLTSVLAAMRGTLAPDVVERAAASKEAIMSGAFVPRDPDRDDSADG